jgi:putative oxidoreductase
VTPSSQSDPATNFAIRISVALVFGLTGLEKFLNSQEWDQVFKAIGWGDWFRYFTGIVEMAGGLMFLLPATTTVGACLLAAAMIGAMTFHIAVLKQPANIIFPGAYLVGVLLAYHMLRSKEPHGDGPGTTKHR